MIGDLPGWAFWLLLLVAWTVGGTVVAVAFTVADMIADRIIARRANDRALSDETMRYVVAQRDPSDAA